MTKSLSAADHAAIIGFHERSRAFRALLERPDEPVLGLRAWKGEAGKPGPLICMRALPKAVFPVAQILTEVNFGHEAAVFAAEASALLESVGITCLDFGENLILAARALDDPHALDAVAIRPDPRCPGRMLGLQAEIDPDEAEAARLSLSDGAFCTLWAGHEAETALSRQESLDLRTARSMLGPTLDALVERITRACFAADVVVMGRRGPLLVVEGINGRGKRYCTSVFAGA